MTEENGVAAATELDYADFLRLLAGSAAFQQRLAAGETLRVATPFNYPGRLGPIVLVLAPGAADSSGQPSIRISDGGKLLQALENQGMDTRVDQILSKTVFHGLAEVEGAGIAQGEVYLDTVGPRLATDMWRFLQMLAELNGLRHSKYKDALLRLSRGQDSPDMPTWTGR